MSVCASLHAPGGFVLALAAAAGLTAPELTAQRIVRGTVVDSTSRPVAYANVEVGARRTIASEAGQFSINVGSGLQHLYVRRIGYAATEFVLEAGTDTVVTLTVAPLARSLARIVVAAEASVRALELRGFYRRLRDRERGINAGQFVTAEEIARRNPTRITQMLEGRSGVRVMRPNPTAPGLRTGEVSNCLAAHDPRCWAPVGLNNCFMTVFLDGSRLTNLARPDTPTFVDQVVMPTHIAGIEIYTTPGKVPPEFQTLSGTCGVILLWSK